MRIEANGLGMFAVGAIVGAGTMFLLDPRLGRARRHYVRDKMVRGINVGRRQTSRFFRDKRNRARGVVAETLGRGRGRDLLSREAA